MESLPFVWNSVASLHIDTDRPILIFKQQGLDSCAVSRQYWLWFQVQLGILRNILSSSAQL